MSTNARDTRIGTDGDGNFDIAERNVISGNSAAGIIIGASSVTNAIIAGNYIGTDVSGLLPLGNSTGVKTIKI